MKFPRNAKILRSPFDVAPFAAVLFLVVIFLILGAFLPTPGVPINLPLARDLPGTDKPTVAMAVDENGRYFFANQMVTNSDDLVQGLRTAAAGSHEPLTLIINADKSISVDQLLRITLLARQAGITNALLATLPDNGAKPARP